jgi:hypothetical protein
MQADFWCISRQLSLVADPMSFVIKLQFLLIMALNIEKKATKKPPKQLFLVGLPRGLCLSYALIMRINCI